MPNRPEQHQQHKNPSIRDFDDEYQACLARLNDENVLDQIDNFSRLARVGRDFASAAEHYGRIIIIEVNIHS
jgi:hypothetical protein